MFIFFNLKSNFNHQFKLLTSDWNERPVTIVALFRVNAFSLIVLHVSFFADALAIFRACTSETWLTLLVSTSLFAEYVALFEIRILISAARFLCIIIYQLLNASFFTSSIWNTETHGCTLSMARIFRRSFLHIPIYRNTHLCPSSWICPDRCCCTLNRYFCVPILHFLHRMWLWKGEFFHVDWLNRKRRAVPSAIIRLAHICVERRTRVRRRIRSLGMALMKMVIKVNYGNVFSGYTVHFRDSILFCRRILLCCCIVLLRRRKPIFHLRFLNKLCCRS